MIEGFLIGFKTASRHSADRAFVRGLIFMNITADRAERKRLSRKILVLFHCLQGFEVEIMMRLFSLVGKVEGEAGRLVAFLFGFISVNS